MEIVSGTGSRIKEAMNKRNIKASEICKATGISPSNMSHYISGSYSPKRRNIYLIAKFLQVSPVWLIGYDCPMETDESAPKGKKELIDYYLERMDDSQLEKTLNFIKEYILK
jgi:transcriptional regulator with XRE-family HTH domain